MAIDLLASDECVVVVVVAACDRKCNESKKKNCPHKHCYSCFHNKIQNLKKISGEIVSAFYCLSFKSHGRCWLSKIM